MTLREVCTTSVYPIGHRWQLWFVQALASRNQNRQFAIWVCLVRRLLNWRPPTLRGQKGKRVISIVPLWRRWTRLAAALLGQELSLHRFTGSEFVVRAAVLDENDGMLVERLEMIMMVV